MLFSFTCCLSLVPEVSSVFIVNRKSLANIEESVFYRNFLLSSVAAKITFRSLGRQGKFSSEIKALVSYLQNNDKSTCHGVSCLNSLLDNSRNGKGGNR